MSWYSWLKATHRRGAQALAVVGHIPLDNRATATGLVSLTAVVQVAFVILTHLVATFVETATHARISTARFPAAIAAILDPFAENPCLTFGYFLATLMLVASWRAARNENLDGGAAASFAFDSFFQIAWEISVVLWIPVPLLLVGARMWFPWALALAATGTLSIHLPRMCVVFWLARSLTVREVTTRLTRACFGRNEGV